MSNEWKHATPDQSKILVKHGIVIDTFWYWLNGDLLTLQEIQRQDCNANRIPAPDVAELGRVLPHSVNDEKGTIRICTTHCYAEDSCNDISIMQNGDEADCLCKHTEAQARAAAVIWLIENKRATWDQEKQMLIAV